MDRRVFLRLRFAAEEVCKMVSRKPTCTGLSKSQKDLFINTTLILRARNASISKVEPIMNTQSHEFVGFKCECG
jgi:hypothetical protein